jgi:hypothetical protein
MKPVLAVPEWSVLYSLALYHFRCIVLHWLFPVLRLAQEISTYMETSTSPINGCKIGLCSALSSFERGGIFIVPRLLWHGALVFLISFERSPHSVALSNTWGDVALRWMREGSKWFLVTSKRLSMYFFAKSRDTMFSNYSISYSSAEYTPYLNGNDSKSFSFTYKIT